MIEYGYISRNIKDDSKYRDIYDLRMKYKAENNPKEKGLKLLLNTTFGAMKNKYNPLFDPKQANQVCISGQLFLVDLLEKLEPYVELLQSNTDGIIFKTKEDDIVNEIMDAWQERTRMSLDVDKVHKIWQKDVNNYIILNEKLDCYDLDEYEKLDLEKLNLKGIKVKGAYVKSFLGGDFKNNKTSIIDRAVVNYFVFGIPPEETIMNSKDLISFQYICKKGPTYLRVEQNGKIVNHCNRVFASKDVSLGKLYKVKEGGREDSIAGLPDHCVILNEDLSKTKFTLDKVDKKWYIKEAHKRINDFIRE